MYKLERGPFDWDPDKEQINIQKHHIDFVKASRAFNDPQRIIVFDKKHSILEQRWYCIGKIESRIVTVRFTMRGKVIRILGAGYWRRGRREYEKEKKQK